MKIAIPLAGGRLCMHFGHCEAFAFVEADEASKTVGAIETLDPPPHEPGVIPRWIAGQGATVALVGGMGPMARQILEGLGVKVVTGAPCGTPGELARAYLDGTLECGENACDH